MPRFYRRFIRIRHDIGTWTAAACVLSLAVPAAACAEVDSGNIQTGRALALRACTGCHVVAPDQPFAPVFTGPSPPPDFSAVANRSNTTAASLRRYLASLPAVPPPGRMANADLNAKELTDVVAYIMSLKQAR